MLGASLQRTACHQSKTWGVQGLEVDEAWHEHQSVEKALIQANQGLLSRLLTVRNSPFQQAELFSNGTCHMLYFINHSA